MRVPDTCERDAGIALATEVAQKIAGDARYNMYLVRLPHGNGESVEQEEG